MLKLLATLLDNPGAKLLQSYKKVAMDSLISAQSFWKDTKDPDTDLYPVLDDDNVRGEMLKKIHALNRVNDVDLRLAHRLSAKWDTLESASNFLSETTYDSLRRDACGLFISLITLASVKPESRDILDSLGSVLSLFHRMKQWKTESATAKNKVNERFKARTTQLSSLAGFPWHFAMEYLGSLASKPTSMLPCNLSSLIQQRNIEEIKKTLSATKFGDAAELIKASDKQADIFRAVQKELEKSGARMQKSETEELAKHEEIIRKNGSDIATCFLVNLIANKLTPLPPTKSRAAFVREYDTSVKELKFDPNPVAVNWLKELMAEAALAEKNAVMKKPVKVRWPLRKGELHVSK